MLGLGPFCHYLLGLVCTCVLFSVRFGQAQLRHLCRIPLLTPSSLRTFISTWLLDLVSKNRFGYVSVSGSALVLLSRQ